MKSLNFLVLLFALSTLVGTSVFAESITKKKTTTITEIESEGEEAATPEESKESEITATFGSQATSGYAGCKTEELMKSTIKELKADCNAWIKDQKSDLKTKFLTSACEESCSDCQTGLRRCNVIGKIRYTK